MPDFGKAAYDLAYKLQTSSSANYQSYPNLMATTTVQKINFGTSMNNIMVTNDGTDDVKIGLQGNSPLGTINDNLDPAWTFTGTWNSDTTGGLHFLGTDAAHTQTIGSKAVYNPNILCNQIAVSFVRGSVSGVAQIELSSDAGVTWVNPSSISGISRSDGAAGTGLDTYNTNNGGVAVGYDLFYLLPTSAKWLIRVSYTNQRLWIDGGKVSSATAITVRPKETQSFTIQSSDIQFASNSGSQPIRLVVTT